MNVCRCVYEWKIYIQDRSRQLAVSVGDRRRETSQPNIRKPGSSPADSRGGPQVEPARLQGKAARKPATTGQAPLGPSAGPRLMIIILLLVRVQLLSWGHCYGNVVGSGQLLLVLMGHAPLPGLLKVVSIKIRACWVEGPGNYSVPASLVWVFTKPCKFLEQRTKGFHTGLMKGLTVLAQWLGALWWVVTSSSTNALQL